MIMRNKFRNSVAAALIGAVTLTSFNLAPAQAASTKAPQATKSATTDFSARRYRHRGNNNAAALAMFGLVAGGIAAAVAADRYNDGYYYGGGPYGGGPYYGGGYYRGGYGHGGWHHHHWHR
jgi:hypothetical protein